jgi:hypothetical protein
MGIKNTFPFSLFQGTHACPVPAQGAQEKFTEVSYHSLYWETFLSGRGQVPLFQEVKTFCFFIGYERSGHSLVGSLLDAHPNIIISHEADVLGLIQKGFSKYQIYNFILENSKNFSEPGRGWSGYSYKVPGQWQGKFEHLWVIGDKKGMGSTWRLNSDPKLYGKILKKMGDQTKVIHHIRNPYDNIGSIHRVRGEKRAKKEWIDYYFRICDAVQKIKVSIPESNVFEERHEDFVSDVKTCLEKLCTFLGVECSEEYLGACDRVVKKGLQESRDAVAWDSGLVDYVQENINKFDYLSRYGKDRSYLPGAFH